MKERILVIAPHFDDEILGVGGTIAKNVAHGNDVFVCIVTVGKEPLFRENGIDIQECRNAHNLLGIKKTYVLDFPAAELHLISRNNLNSKILEVVQEIKPDAVFIPHRGDMHTDHVIVSESAMVALRPKYEFAPRRIYAYETLSETGWDIPNIEKEFLPNVYEDISMFLPKKIDAMKCYQSQLASFPNARSLEAMESLAKFRGAMMNLQAAEAFMLIREIK